MFCKQCGKKVAPGTPRCPHCGREADVLSGGTGFWDLTTPPASATAEIPTPTPAPVQIPETPVIPQPLPQQPAPPPVVEREPQRPRKNPLKPFVLLLGLVALILVIALAVTAVRAGRLSDQLEEANAALALQEAEAVQEEAPPAPASVPSPVITPNPSEEPTSEPTPEPSPSEEPEPSPSQEPEPSEEPEEAQPAGNDNVAENPLLPLTAEFSRDMNRLTLSVDPGDLKVAEYQWIIVYDSALETVEDCLEVLAETQLQEDPTVVKSMKGQVDPYDNSSGTAAQELDLTVFYPDHTAFSKRVFCKMTLEDGSVQCSQLVSPGPEAAKDCVITRQRKDIVTAEVALPETVETENISVSYMELIPREEVTAADMQPYEEDFRLEIPVVGDGTYYVILSTGDAVYPITGAIIPE